jgi:hypothetical protein
MCLLIISVLLNLICTYILRSKRGYDARRKMSLREIVTEDLKCCADGNETVYIPTE